MRENHTDIELRHRICDSQYIRFYSLEMCKTVRRFNGPNAVKERAYENGFTGTICTDKSYSEPDYMNLVGLAEKLMNVNGVEHVAFMPYSVRIFMPKHFFAHEVADVCRQIIDIWTLTRDICKEAAQ